jgi:hypothetical protein
MPPKLCRVCGGLVQALAHDVSTQHQRAAERGQKAKTTMAIIVKDTGNVFAPAPEGLHQAVCVDVIDLGEQDTPWGKKHKIALRFELDSHDPDTKKPYQVSKWYTASLSELATLRQHLESWRGRAFTEEELAGFDAERLVGVNAQLSIIHQVTDKKKTFAAIQTIVPLGKGMTKIRPSADYVRMKDRPNTTTTDPAAGATPAADEPEF